MDYPSLLKDQFSDKEFSFLGELVEVSLMKLAEVFLIEKDL
jgi:hypothetical protein